MIQTVSSFALGMIGRVMVIVGVLVPMLAFNDPNQTSPLNILFWVITIVGLGLWIYGRMMDRKERQKRINQKVAQNKVDIEL